MLMIFDATKILNRIKNTAATLAAGINALSDRTVFWWITISYFSWRLLTLPMFETSGDAAWKWRFLRYFYATGIWFPHTPEHHQGRWAQNIPVYWLMELFDSSDPWIGAVVPVLSGFVVLLLVWKIARLFTTQAAALAAVFITAGNPVFINESAQLLPSMGSTMYILLTLYLFLLYIKSPAKWFLPLAAGLTMGLAWGCKVTSVYWALGIGIFLLINQTGGKNIAAFKKIRIGWDVVLFTAGFLLIFIPETLIINHCFDLTLGRIGMLGGHHGNNPRLVQFNLIEYIFAPLVIFLNLSGKFIRSGVMASLFLLAVTPAVIKIRSKKISPEEKFLLFVMFAALICHCYMVVKVFPFKHPERPLVRYFLALYCVWSVIIVSFRHSLLEIGGKRIQSFISIAYKSVFFFLCALLAVNLINDPIIKKHHLFTKIRVYRCMAIHKKQNTPVLVRFEHGRKFRSRTFKNITAWESFFGDLKKLPEYQKPNLEILENEYMARTPYEDSKGDLYFHLWGKKIDNGAVNRCIIIDDDFVRYKEMQLSEKKNHKNNI